MSAAPFGLTAKKGLRLHAESGGLRQVVSNGDYTVRVQHGDWTVLAKDAVKFESKTGVVRLQTKGGEYFVEVGLKERGQTDSNGHIAHWIDGSPENIEITLG